MKPRVQRTDDVTIRFAGDSGDGMQLTGAQFTNVTALAGNDLSTLPDFPAEIRAPAGTLAGVSGFQLHFSSHYIHTPGDVCDALVVMNPAALKVNLPALRKNGVLIINTDTFKPRNLTMAGYETNPLEDGSLSEFQVHALDITRMTRESVKDLGLSNKEADRCKNFFALGMAYWLYSRPMEPTLSFIEEKFGKRPKIAEANRRALKAGYNFCLTTQGFAVRYEVPPAKLPPGTYRNITGNTATVLGIVAAGQKSGLDVFLGSYPITPASDILHLLSRYRNFGVRTFQAEDEIAAVCAAIGAAYGGALAFTCTSGPGLDLKAEAIGLAVSVELPLVIIDVQRAGPSTGLPTKTEQSDLLTALYGRHGETPVPVITAASPFRCFEGVYDAARIAVKYMTPVIFLSDLYLAFGAEPWLIPRFDELPPIRPEFARNTDGFMPYRRDKRRLARPWAIPGTPGMEHRVGGLEKKNPDGVVSYDPQNHELMTNLRAEKMERIARELPPLHVEGPENGDLLVVSWGSTFGAVRTAVQNKQAEGAAIAQVHLRHLNPLPLDLGEILKRYKRILVPECNLGQLLKVLRAVYLVPAVGLNKVQGLPFETHEVEEGIDSILRGET